MSKHQVILLLLIVLSASTILARGDDYSIPLLLEDAAFVAREWAGGVVTFSNALPYNFSTDLEYRWATHVARMETADFDEDGRIDYLMTCTFGQAGETYERHLVIGEWAKYLLLFYGDGQGGFHSVRRVAHDAYVDGATAADVDGDGHLDVVVRINGEPAGTRFPNESLRICYGDGTGNFPDRRDYFHDDFESLGRWLVSDVNGDAIADLVAVGTLLGDPSKPLLGARVMVGAGNREFLSTVDSSVGYFGDSAANLFRLVDVNQDGHPDLVAAIQDFERRQTPEDLEERNNVIGLGAFDRYLVVGTNDGGARFRFQEVVQLDFWPHDMTVADFDGDRDADVAFSEAIASRMELIARDRHHDLLGLERYDRLPTPQISTELPVRIFSVEAGAISPEPLKYDLPFWSAKLCSGDLNRDGLDDLVAFSDEGKISAQLGNSETLLGPMVGYSCATATVNPVWAGFLADVNGDGDLDVGAQYLVNAVITRFGDGTGGFGTGWFSPPIESEIPAGPDLFQPPMDVDQDGHLDLVFYSEGFPYAGVAFGDGAGRFPQTTLIEYIPAVPQENEFLHSIRRLVAGDLNGDSLVDVVLHCEYDADPGFASEIRIYLNDGARGLEEIVGGTPEQPARSRDMAIVDFNEDGHLDLFISYNIAPPSLLLGTGTGSFVPGGSVETDASDGEDPDRILAYPRVADFNEDGHLDLLAVCRDSYSLILLLGDGTGTLREHVRFAPGRSLLGIGDLNEDGHLDVYTGSSSYLGDGTGGFSDPVPSGEVAGATAPGLDFNRDGHLDFVHDMMGVTRIVLGVVAQDIFATDTEALTPNTRFAWGDFDEDGWIDLATSTYDKVSVLLNRFSQSEEAE